MKSRIGELKQIALQAVKCHSWAEKLPDGLERAELLAALVAIGPHIDDLIQEG